MALNSVNTNNAAAIALTSLELTNTQLGTVQKQISTGYRVADATDDGAAYAIAQKVRSDTGALQAVNQVLSGVQGLVSTTLTALTGVSTKLGSARDVLVQLASSNTQGTQRTQYIAQYESLLKNVKSYFQDAAYNNETLLGGLVGSIGNTSGSTLKDINVVRNEIGVTYGIYTFNNATSAGFSSGSASQGASYFWHAISYGASNILKTGGGQTLLTNAACAAAALTATGSFITALNRLGTQLNYYGSVSNFLTNQVNYNDDKISSLQAGLGSLVDADLAKESAALQSLQIRQQLGTQALSIANQAPQALLSLFK